MKRALTVRSIEQAKPTAARREIPDAYLPGLYLVVQPSGAKSWAVRYRHHGKPRKLTLGSHPKLDLKTARERGGKALRTAAEARDPAQEKKAQDRINRDGDMERVTAEFIERHCKRSNRPRSAQETERLLRLHVLPRLRGRTITSITRRDILDILDGVIESGAPIAANRTLSAVRKMFNWAVAKDMLASTPCAGVKPPTRERSRDRVLSDEELRLVWHAADEVGWPYGRMVQALILTGQRRDEVARMRRQELDLEAKTWTLSRGRVKNDKGHEVPLSDAAITLLESLPRLAGDYVFTTTGISASSGYSKGKHRLDQYLLAAMERLATERGDAALLAYIAKIRGLMAKVAKAKGTAAKRAAAAELRAAGWWVLHDLRRTLASGMARLGVNLPVVEKLLNHVGKSFSGVAGVYQRHEFKEEKRTALTKWGEHVTALIATKNSRVTMDDAA